ncbi:MAG: glycosyltransferase [Gammaproteobacteria bacterium]|nr:glycosyltransferase [Gammaproteobacteria bacterium]
MTSRKKIAIVTPHHWTGSYGGAEYQISLLIGELAKTHPDLELHYLCKPSPDHIQPQDHTIHEVTAQRWFSKYGTFFDAFGLYKALKTLQPDYIYQRVGCAYTGVCAWYCKHSSASMLWHIASDADVGVSTQRLFSRRPHHYIEQKVFEYGIRHANKIVAQQQHQADQLEKNFSRSVDAVIANFQPVPELLATQNERRLVLWIGNLKELKQPDLFIDLAEQIGPIAGVSFCMAGRPQTGKWGDRLLARLNSCDAVEYLGEISQQEVYTLLEQTRLLVNTSQYEGFPNTFIQAWMRETPVLSLQVNPDGILDRHPIGIMSGNFEHLVRDCRELLENREKHDIMAKSARTYAIENHSLLNVEKLLQVLTG